MHQNKIETLQSKAMPFLNITLDVVIIGVKEQKRIIKSAFWLKKAAKEGFAQAQYNLALLYDSGRGVKKDSERQYIGILKRQNREFWHHNFFFGFTIQMERLGEIEKRRYTG